MLPMIHERTIIGPVLLYGHFSQGFKRRVGLETILRCKARLRVAINIPAIHVIIVEMHCREKENNLELVRNSFELERFSNDRGQI